MEPVPFVRSDAASGLDFYHRSFPFAQETAYEIIIINLSQETNALTIPAFGRWQTLRFRNAPHLFFHQVAHRKHQLCHLQTVNLRQKVRLVFHGVACRTQPYLTVPLAYRGIMSRGDFVVPVSHLLFKASEFDKLVAHHVRIRSQSPPGTLHGVAHHKFPILLLQVHHLKVQAVTACRSRRKLYVLLGRTAQPFVLHSYLNIKQIRLISHFANPVDGHCAVHSA